MSEAGGARPERRQQQSALGVRARARFSTSPVRIILTVLSAEWRRIPCVTCRRSAPASSRARQGACYPARAARLLAVGAREATHRRGRHRAPALRPDRALAAALAAGGRRVALRHQPSGELDPGGADPLL